jgi:hypothetical protein
VAVVIAHRGVELQFAIKKLLTRWIGHVSGSRPEWHMLRD